MKRFNKWLKHCFIQYVPSSTKLVDNEAKRLTKFITSNYTENEQIVILKKMREYTVDHSENQLKDKELLIIDETSNLKHLNENLTILVNLR